MGKNLIIKGKINFLATFLYEILQFTIKVLPLHSENGRFRSSVGLEQRPSKAWVLGSNPNGITYDSMRVTSEQNNVKEDSTSVVSSLLLIYS